MIKKLYSHWSHKGPDRYISRIRYKYHPGLGQNRDNMFKFSFPEFVRFLMNGTEEFADDPMCWHTKKNQILYQDFLMDAKILSRFRDIHEARFRAKTDYIIHMETLSKDLATVLEDTQLSQHMDLFPHTHSQTGGTLLIPIQQLPVSAVKQAAVTAV